MTKAYHLFANFVLAVLASAQLGCSSAGVASAVQQTDAKQSSAALGSMQPEQRAKTAVLSQCDGADVTLLAPEAQAQDSRNAIFIDREWIRWPRSSALTNGDRFRLAYSTQATLRAQPGQMLSGQSAALDLELGSLPSDLQAKANYLGATGVTLRLTSNAQSALADSAPLAAQWWIVQEDSRGRVKSSGALQWAWYLDQRFVAANALDDLGVSAHAGGYKFAVWAPTAEAVAVCFYADAGSPAYALEPLKKDEATGLYSVHSNTPRAGQYYRYLLDVFVPGLGKVRNRSTDPYAISLSADSQRSYVGSLADANLSPPGWQENVPARELAHQTDMQIYELHVRDFSISDLSVRSAWRGKYLAFTETASLGAIHLKAMAQAGLTDLHLLPVFDLATVPERNCEAVKIPKAKADGAEQRAAVQAARERDCFNWGYDPWHFGAPEGSYATNAEDGAVRIREFRAMVDAMHRIGLRVGMDVVYNHTTASGQNQRSVLDRIVPGYYQRLNADGFVERSTCCENTATEHLMMAKLMRDTLLRFALEYRIDSFRFDLIGHQPKDAMVEIKSALNTATGRDIQLIGEGWNFGEVANNARFVQATQANLAGTGIASFSDRMRDAARGGGCCDGPADLAKRQGYLTGLDYARNSQNSGTDSRSELLKSADLIKLSLAGTVRDFRFMDANGSSKLASQIEYSGQPGGYVAEPSEVVNYVENHDNPTLFDVSVLKLPLETSSEERARVQALGMALVAMSQGVAYYHAGMELMRSKSFDRNSFDSGDHFNRLDWSFKRNFFGMGLPPGEDRNYDALIGPHLVIQSLRPSATDLDWTRRMFLSLLKLRSSTPLLRLDSAAEIKARLKIHNTGSAQIATVLAASIEGSGYENSGFRKLAYFINVGTNAQSVNIPELSTEAWQLHPLQAQVDYPDARVRMATSNNGVFTIPPRTAVVFVVR